MTSYDKLTPEQFAQLELTTVTSKPIPEKVILAGTIFRLATVAANALTVLDSSLREERADELSPLVDKLWEGEEIHPAFGQFSLRLLRRGAAEDGTEVGELHVGLRLAGPPLMNLIHKALEASVQQSDISE